MVFESLHVVIGDASVLKKIVFISLSLNLNAGTIVENINMAFLELLRRTAFFLTETSTAKYI